MDERGSMHHVPALDGLRGIAVAGVIAFHLGWFDGGFLGVDLFFALSGYLITSLLAAEAASGRIALREFWARRARRLLPAVALLIAVVLGWLAVWGTSTERATGLVDARWALPYLANWHLVAAARDYWAATSSASVFNHLWSLAIEEQFYVVWPLVAWALLRGRWRRAQRRLSAVALLLAAASAVTLVAVFRAGSPSRGYFGTDTRAAALLLGAVAALAPVGPWVRSLVQRHPRRADAVAGLLVTGLLASWWYAGHHVAGLLHGSLAGHGLAAAAMVAAVAALSPSAVTARLLGGRPLVWLGQRSYGLYLWHWPVIVLAGPRVTRWPSGVRSLFELAVTVVVTVVSYRLVEHPIRRRTGWARGPRAAGATFGVVALAVGALVIAPDGRGDIAGFDPSHLAASPSTSPATTVGPPSTRAPGRLPAAVRADPDGGTTATTATTRAAPATTAAAAPSTSPPTTAVPSTSSTALVVDPTVGHRVLWIGDSVAADEAPALRAALAAAHVPLVDGAFVGRRLVSSEGVDAAALYPPIVRDAHADLVVVQLSLWDSPFTIDRQRAAFTWFRDLIRTSGADLVFVTPPPVRADLVDPGLARQLQVVGELAADDPAHVQLIDTAVVWGPAAVADLDGDGVPDRKPDLVHVCPQGAARVAIALVDALAVRFPAIHPASPDSWLGGRWARDRTYDTPAGACARLGGG